MSTSAINQSLRDVSSSIYYTKLVNVGAFALLVYDYIITFGREKELLWEAPLRWGKFLFITIRYFTLALMTFIIVVMFSPRLNLQTYVLPISNEFSGLANGGLQWLGGVVIVMLTELTLQLRLYAMYEKSRKIFAVLAITFLATFAVTFVLAMRLFLTEGAIFLSLLPLYRVFICAPTHISGYFREVWLPVFVHELFLMSLAGYKGFQMLRRKGAEGYVNKLTMLLVRDSIHYYFAVFVVFFSMELVWIILGPNYLELPFGLIIIIASLMCQRQLLKIRSHYHANIRANAANSRSLEGGEAILLHTIRTPPLVLDR